jgi:pre-mRNA-splicing factor SYF2
MPAKRSPEQSAEKPASSQAEQRNDEDKKAAQKEPEVLEPSENSSTEAIPMKEDDSAAKARQRQERFKALQARAVGPLGFFISSVYSLSRLTLA